MRWGAFGGGPRRDGTGEAVAITKRGAGVVSQYTATCPVCLDPISPSAPTVEVVLATGERAKVHEWCAVQGEASPPAPKRMCGADRGKEREDWHQR